MIEKKTLKELDLLNIKYDNLTIKYDNLSSSFQTFFVNKEIRNFRDSFKCRVCKTNKKLEAHHIKTFHSLLIDNNIFSIDDALKCSELWDLENGLTLCNNCHKIFKNGGGNINSEFFLVGDSVNNIELIPLSIIEKLKPINKEHFTINKLAKSIKKNIRKNVGFSYFNQYLSIKTIILMLNNYIIDDEIRFNFKIINKKIGNSSFYDRFKSNEMFVVDNNVESFLFINPINKIFLQHIVK